ncbi:MAG TPA: methyltransferase domain-containing protein [Vicinamibacterales bacterium]|nr:methyltransferase domain-containing protein [Vicinamibacterales bacterium]
MTDLTTVGHWDKTWAGDIRLRLPSPWVVSTRNLQRLLRRHVRPGDRFLEIGCAPGKLLAWVAADLRAEVAGLDVSERGLTTASRLFDALHLKADLRREDLRQTTFQDSAFDVVLSVGLIEHFSDPRDVVRKHLELARPGGTVLMTVPNYRGIYGRLKEHFEPESLLQHNLDIMTCEALVGLVDKNDASAVTAYHAGRLSPWQTSWKKRWPAPVATSVSLVANTVALLQPVDVAALCPMLVLEVRRRRTEAGASQVN